jgi:DNA-binding cell septation regulator SpoVG
MLPSPHRSRPPTEAELQASWGIRPSTIKISKWTPFRNPAGTMLGFLSVELPSGMIVNDLKLMVGQKGRRWIALPSVKQLDKEGQPRLDINGKATWSAIVDFRNREIREKFQDQILTAMRHQYPELFASEGAA